jgi:autotransporter-associated beta strand protein
MNASTSVSFSSGTSLTFAGSISGAGTRTLAFNGTGTATLTGSNTYTGPTTVGAGATLQLGDGTTAAHDPTLATSGITVSNTSTVAFNTVTGTYNVNYPISGAGQIVKNGSNTLNLTVANAFNTTGSTHSSQGVQINAGTVNLGAVYAANASSNSVINVGAGANVTESVTNALSGFSGINLGTPTSSATLNYNNNTGFYSAINGGNLTLGAGGALGTALLFLGYGTLTADADLTGANAITTPVHLNGGGDPTAGSSTILPGHNITFNCSVGTVSNYANDYFTQSDSPQVWNIDNALTTIQCPVRLGLRTSSPFNPAGYGNLVITGSISNYNTNAGYVGSLLYSGTGTLSLSGANSFTGGAQINSGTLVLQNSNAIPTGTSLTVNSPGKVSVNNSGGSKLIVTVSSLTNTGQIDLQNNDMVIQGAGASIGTYFSQLQSGYNNGNWNGTSGIVSSTAAGSSLYTLGIATGLSSGVDGSGSGDVVIKYTYYGDALLTGSVTTADYTQIDNGFLSGTATGWQNGDFNYDGVINGSDYTLIDNAFNTQGANIATQFASPTAQLAGAGTTSAVPEPTTLGLLALAATGLLGRRRSRVR